MINPAVQNRMCAVPDTERAPSSGATLLELITVLLIVGIIGAVVIGRGDMGNADLLAQAEVIKAHIRYAQSRSLDSTRRWGIQVAESGQAYWLFVDGQANRRNLPGEASDTVDLADNGLTLSAMRVSFNDHGQPCSDDSGTVLLADDLDLVLSAGGESATIRITRNTGFIP
jgi:MSHA pilin protein MshC